MKCLGRIKKIGPKIYDIKDSFVFINVWEVASNKNFGVFEKGSNSREMENVSFF